MGERGVSGSKRRCGDRPAYLGHGWGDDRPPLRRDPELVEDLRRTSIGEHIVRLMRQPWPAGLHAPVEGDSAGIRTGDRDRLRNVMAFARRVDFTYWPEQDCFEIHWHTDDLGDTPARVLVRPPADAEAGS